MKPTKVLFSDKFFDVVDIQGLIGIMHKEMSVAILPYTTKDDMIDEIGLLHEVNHFREGGFCDTLITGTVEHADDTLLYTAIRELKEEGGIDASGDENLTRWLFLGPIYLYKDSDRVVPVFSVDVTGLIQSVPSGDGSEKEAASKLVMTNIGAGISSDESLVLGAFLRLFNYMYAKSMNNV